VSRLKVVILAGGLGTRIREETHAKPKAMVKVGDKPILWHIMKIFSHYGFNDFIVCLGYKGDVIKRYFTEYELLKSDFTINFRDNARIEIHHRHVEPWQVTLVDTGLHTMTGGRLRRIRPYIGEETCMMTYGDGVGDIDIPRLLRYHRSHGKQATVTVTRQPNRFGVLRLSDSGQVDHFVEKPELEQEWINAGFFVLEPGVFQYLTSDQTVWEKEPMKQLVEQKELMAYQHTGFWHPMDTLRDKEMLEQWWTDGAPWKVWKKE